MKKVNVDNRDSWILSKTGFEDSDSYELFYDGYSVATVTKGQSLWIAMEHSWLAPSTRFPVYAWSDTLDGIPAQFSRAINDADIEVWARRKE